MYGCFGSTFYCQVHRVKYMNSSGAKKSVCHHQQKMFSISISKMFSISITINIYSSSLQVYAALKRTESYILSYHIDSLRVLRVCQASSCCVLIVQFYI